MSKFHFFTDYDLLQAQTVNQAFGPAGTTVISGTTYDRYRVTNLHTATGTPRAYAICDGTVCAQIDDSNPTLINIIIRPSQQPLIDFRTIEYYLYKGIKLDSLVDTSTMKISDTSTMDLARRIREAKINNNLSYDKANNLTPGTTTTKASADALGIGYKASASGANQIADNEPIDNLFFREHDGFQLQDILAGETLGYFDSTKFGIEIILASHIQIECKFSRNIENVIEERDAPASSSELDIITYKSKKEKILSFIDPCAFFANLALGNLQAKDSSDILYKYNENINGFYSQILKLKFKNCNRTYVDIRNENSYSINYYGNYSSNMLDMSIFSILTTEGTTASSDLYDTSNWPIRIIEGLDFVTKNPLNTFKSNLIKLSLPQGDNDNPVVYLKQALTFYDFPKYNLNQERFIDITFNSSWTNFIELSAPNYTSSGTINTEPIAHYLSFQYIKAVNKGLANANLITLPSQHYIDNIFPIDSQIFNTRSKFLKLRASGTTKCVKLWYERFIDATDELGFSGILSIYLSVDDSKIMYYAVAEHFYKVNKKKTDNFNLNTSISSMGDVFENLRSAEIYDTKKIKIVPTINSPEYYLSNDVFSYESNFFSQQLLFLGMSKTEFLNLISNISPLDDNLHQLFISKDNFEHKTDTNSYGYLKLSLKISGLKASDGKYAYYQPASALSFCGDRGNCFTTNTMSAIITTGPVDGTEYLIWDRDRYNNSGGVNFRISSYNNTAIFPIYNYAAAVLTFGVGEPYTGNIMLPMGTRVLVLGRNRMSVVNTYNKVFVKVICWIKGKYRDGLVDENTIINSLSVREFNYEAYQFKEEAIMSFIDDAENVIYESNRIGEDTFTYDYQITPLTMKYINADSRITDLSKNPQAVDFYEVMNKRLENMATSLLNFRTAFDNAVTKSALINDFYDKLIKPHNAEFQGEKTITNDPFFVRYYEDKPDTIAKVLSDSSYVALKNPSFTIAVGGSPTSGKMILTYNSTTKEVNFPVDEAILQSKVIEVLGITAKGIISYSKATSELELSNKSQFYKFVFSNNKNINLNNLTLSVQSLVGNNPTVKLHKKTIVLPITMGFIRDTPGIKTVYNSAIGILSTEGLYSGEVFGIDGSNGSNFQVYQKEIENNLIHDFSDADKAQLRNNHAFTRVDFYYLKLAELKFYKTMILTDPNIPNEVVNSPEGQWLVNTDFEDVECIIQLMDYCWGIYTLNTSTRTYYENYFLSKMAEYIPIDQSIGYINSNPIASIVYHESDQLQNNILMRDSHVSGGGAGSYYYSTSNENILWKALVVEYKSALNMDYMTAINNIKTKNVFGPGQVEAFYAFNAFINNPLLASFNLKKILTLLGY